jgi:hypothetical protein
MKTLERPPMVNINRRELNSFPLRKADPKLHRNLEAGWLLPYLTIYDDALWHRWDWWAQHQVLGAVSEDSEIPQIWFEGSPHAQTLKMLEQSLDAIPEYGSWRGWSSSSYFDWFLDWLLYGLGNAAQREFPAEPSGCRGASNRLYQIFQLGPMQLWPHDYFGHLMAEMEFGRHCGFFPTPLTICELMAGMLFGNQAGSLHKDGSPHKLEEFHDPCVGTGRMPMVASNHCLNLSGMDINRTCVRACEVNAALYAPWMYRPFPFLDKGKKTPSAPAQVIAAMRDAAQLGEWQQVLVASAHSSGIPHEILRVLDESSSLTVQCSSEELAAEVCASGIAAFADPLPDGKLWDRVILTPSHFNHDEVRAVQTAFEHVAPGGKLVAWLSDRALVAHAPRFQAFRLWLILHDHNAHQIDGAAGQLVVIRKGS